MRWIMRRRSPRFGVATVRDALVQELISRAEADSSVMLVTGDLGYGVVEQFQVRLPKQFINAGIAEQNMTGVAAGLASQGFSVVLYSITNFVSLRNLEQIRNDICQSNLPVTIVGVGAGLSYGSLGYSHHGVEDVSVVRALPNIGILNPSNSIEARAALHFSLDDPGPHYIRLGRDSRHERGHDREVIRAFGPPTVHRQGDQLVLLTTGAITCNVLDASDALGELGVRCSVYSFPVIAPFSQSWLLGIPHDVPILCIEEHTTAGGFGSIVMENLCQTEHRASVSMLGTKVEHYSLVGDQAFLQAAHGLDARGIAQAALALLDSPK